MRAKPTVSVPCYTSVSRTSYSQDTTVVVGRSIALSCMISRVLGVNSNLAAATIASFDAVPRTKDARIARNIRALRKGSQASYHRGRGRDRCVVSRQAAPGGQAGQRMSEEGRQLVGYFRPRPKETSRGGRTIGGEMPFVSEHHRLVHYAPSLFCARRHRGLLVVDSATLDSHSIPSSAPKRTSDALYILRLADLS